MADTIVSIHQPNFLPWVKLLDKILASDVYVAYDTVIYTKTEYHARQKILTDHGPDWLSVPLLHIRGKQQIIKDVRIDNGQPFRRRHLRRLRLSYGTSPYFDEVYPIIEEVFGRHQERLVDLNIDLIEAICAYLDAPVRIVRASALPHEGDRTGRLLQLVEAAGGNHHLTSTFGSHHQDVDWPRFHAEGVGLLVQRFEHPRYDQVGGGDFVPNLAAIDMLFACGAKTAQILASRRQLIPVDADGETGEPYG